MGLTRQDNLLFNHLLEESLGEGIVILLTLQCLKLTISILLFGRRALPLEELRDADKEVRRVDAQAKQKPFDYILIYLILNGLLLVHIEATPFLNRQEEA